MDPARNPAPRSRSGPPVARPPGPGPPASEIEFPPRFPRQWRGGRRSRHPPGSLRPSLPFPTADRRPRPLPRDGGPLRCPPRGAVPRGSPPTPPPRAPGPPQKYEATIRECLRTAEEIEAAHADLRDLSDAELQARTGAFRERLAAGETADDLLVEAFATVREAAKRVLGMEHYKVQLAGGVALHRGTVAEMATGEGKTLLATCPAYLNALGGRGVHVVTVNAYLAQRDAQTMGKVFGFLGLSVGCVTEASGTEEKRAAYRCDVLYVTATELCFDYLRSRSASSRHGVLTLRAPHYCIIDEVDSILVDLASQPLLLSERRGEDGVSEDLMKRAVDLARTLRQGTHFTLDRLYKEAKLTDEGTRHCDRVLGAPVWDTTGGGRAMGAYLNVALTALHSYRRGVDYALVDGQVVLVDASTGRVMERTRLQNYLHSALEVVCGVPMEPEQVTIASSTYQTVFRYYDKVSGMTGTAATEQEELHDVYGLQVVPVPPNRESRRRDDPVWWCSAPEHRDAVIAHVILDAWADAPDESARRPFLIGTRSIVESEQLSAALDAAGVPHRVLNAKPELAAQEAAVVAQAGRPGAVTIATNMAGRGTDILLGGNAAMLAEVAVAGLLRDALDGPDGGLVCGVASRAELVRGAAGPEGRRRARELVVDAVLGGLAAHRFAPETDPLAHPPPQYQGSQWGPSGLGQWPREWSRVVLGEPASALRALLVEVDAAVAAPGLMRHSWPEWLGAAVSLKDELRRLTRAERQRLATLKRKFPKVHLFTDVEAFLVPASMSRVWGAMGGRASRGAARAGPWEEAEALVAETAAGNGRGWGLRDRGAVAALARALVCLEVVNEAVCRDDGDRVRAGGGLTVVSAQVEPSKRVELQLLGRAGRQGDPGQTMRIWSVKDPFLER